MSFCRFSSDDYQCDLYVYDDIGGYYVTHVAQTRPVYAEPLPDRVPFERFLKWYERHQIVTRMYIEAEKRSIGLPYDGERFEDREPHELIERLRMLKAAGYRFPDEIIDAVAMEPPRDEQDAGAGGLTS